MISALSPFKGFLELFKAGVVAGWRLAPKPLKGLNDIKMVSCSQA
jgi:hypothetical protein